ncbi:MAG: hypothetical protein WDN44_02690 [Sphingomonas sp.]
MALPIALAACRSDSDPAPGGVTVGEAKQLDQAAQDTDINANAPNASAPENSQ